MARIPTRDGKRDKRSALPAQIIKLSCGKTVEIPDFQATNPHLVFQEMHGRTAGSFRFTWDGIEYPASLIYVEEIRSDDSNFVKLVICRSIATGFIRKIAGERKEYSGGNSINVQKIVKYWQNSPVLHELAEGFVREALVYRVMTQ